MPYDKNSSIYPYTLACDWLRSIVTTRHDGLGGDLPVLSRAEASRIRTALSHLWGVDDRKAAELMADQFIKEQNEEEYKDAMEGKA